MVNFNGAWSKAFTFTCGRDNPKIIYEWGCRNKKGIYVFTDKYDNQILYIGMAGSNISDRLYKHVTTEGNKGVGDLASDGETFNIRWALSRQPDLAESIAIIQLAPVFNKKSEWDINNYSLEQCISEAQRLGLLPHDTQLFNNIALNLCEALGLRVRENLRAKEELCKKAESLSTSTDWKKTSETYKVLVEQWKKTGSVGREKEDELWNQFRASIDRFYHRRKEYFLQFENEKERNRKKKEALCKEAELLIHSTDWKATGDSFKKLLDQWKSIGPTNREDDEKLWQRFSIAKNFFFDRRSEYYEQRKMELSENLKRKLLLCAEAESLTSFGAQAAGIDGEYIKKKVKELQTEWKTIGHVPKERTEEVWNRFRRACDKVFEWQKSERERKQAEWREKMKETIARKKEKVNRILDSIRHDEKVIDQKWEKISNLRPGGRYHEIRQSLETQIQDIKRKIESKHRSVREIQSSIRDLEIKIYGL